MARTVHGELPVAFHYTPGVGNTAFFEALRDRGVLLGSRCEACGVTYLPARIFCERCFAELAADTECGPGGTLESFTTGYVGIDGEPLDAPGHDRPRQARQRRHRPDASTARRTARGRSARGSRPSSSTERTGSILDVEGFRQA